MGKQERESSGVGVGLIIALVAVTVLAVPCIGGVLLFGLVSSRTVSVPGQPLPAPSMVAPTMSAPVVEPQPPPSDTSSNEDASSNETVPQADKAARSQ